jgi:hypothetical protein
MNHFFKIQPRFLLDFPRINFVVIKKPLLCDHEGHEEHEGQQEYVIVFIGSCA